VNSLASWAGLLLVALAGAAPGGEFECTVTLQEIPVLPPDVALRRDTGRGTVRSFNLRNRFIGIAPSSWRGDASVHSSSPPPISSSSDTSSARASFRNKSIDPVFWPASICDR